MTVWYRWRRINVRFDDQKSMWFAGARRQGDGQFYWWKYYAEHENIAPAVAGVKKQIDDAVAYRSNRRRRVRSEWRAFRKNDRGAC